MRFVIYGAGGVGGVIGAQLAKSGERVTLIARGAHLDAIRRNGLRYQTPYVDETIAIDVVGHPAELEPTPDDVFVLTMKSQHTEQALEELRAAMGDAVPVVCCQNGVTNERIALRRFAEVYAMLVYLPAQLVEAGVVQCHSRLKSGILDLGRYPGGIDERAVDVARRLEAANFSVRPDPTVMRAKYAKLLMNLNNALGALCGSGEEVADLRAQLREEGRACLAAAGIDVASEDEVRERRRSVFEIGEIPGVERVGGSSRQSLLRGTGNIETDYLNGEIVLLGRLHGVATPANRVVQRLANELARTKGEPGSVPASRVESLIARVS